MCSFGIDHCSELPREKASTESIRIAIEQRDNNCDDCLVHVAEYGKWKNYELFSGDLTVGAMVLAGSTGRMFDERSLYGKVKLSAFATVSDSVKGILTAEYRAHPFFDNKNSWHSTLQMRYSDNPNSDIRLIVDMNEELLFNISFGRYW